MGKRIFAVIALITLAMVMAACERQTSCYRDGNRERKPPMPFAALDSELGPTLALIQSF
ncbi:hypothetical protein [Microbulbifer sp. YPW1]|uniref:hypothetical protein n=1 Tax=Microbulbifer sp. YPW1 TaxID=2745199 RepID=UPI00159905C4|nr:hypothetical protein [Microbulbifer sp. YPW1]QKX16398.1 hypothetical protein HUW35_05005 [Microbulbifer sp. YPW1]